MKGSITHSVYWLIATLHVAIRCLPSLVGAPCNSFPKMFGGSSEDAYLKHIDVFDDYLAFTGMTSDSSLTSINY